MNADGNCTTDVYETQFTTDDVTPSDNVLSCEVVKTYSNGCDVKVTASNNDPYIVEAQPKAAWDKYLSNNGNDAVKAASEILRVSYSDADNYTVTGNYEGKKEVGSSNTEYVLIVCGYDSGVTTDVQVVPFKTLAE